jgi:hypothetical protein
VYAVGGWDGSARLNSVEKYDSKLGTEDLFPDSNFFLLIQNFSIL